MNIIPWLASIVAGVLAVMMTVISYRVLRDTFLDNPLIHVAVGVLTFIGLRYRPSGLIGMILLGYEDVPIAILFFLLWMGFQKVSQAHKERKQKEMLARQASQLREGQQKFQKPKAQSSSSEIQKRKG
ncbi:MAG: hypothetical protein WCK77_25425 [Verrucomicrobiota bacterium]